MIGGVTRRMLSHLSGVPHLHVNRPLEVGNNKGAQSNQLHWEHFSNTLGPRCANILLSVKNQFIYLVVWLCVFEYMITMLDFYIIFADGSQFAPRVSENDTLYVFSPDICRCVI